MSLSFLVIFDCVVHHLIIFAGCLLLYSILLYSLCIITIIVVLLKGTTHPFCLSGCSIFYVAIFEVFLLLLFVYVLLHFCNRQFSFSFSFNLVICFSVFTCFVFCQFVVFCLIFANIYLQSVMCFVSFAVCSLCSFFTNTYCCSICVNILYVCWYCFAPYILSSWFFSFMFSILYMSCCGCNMPIFLLVSFVFAFIFVCRDCCVLHYQFFFKSHSCCCNNTSAYSPCFLFGTSFFVDLFRVMTGTCGVFVIHLFFCNSFVVIFYV